MAGIRDRVRVNAAQALHDGATRDDLMADLLCVSRGVNAPGPREREDAEHLARLWSELDGVSPD